MTLLDPLVYERVKQATVAIALMIPDKSGVPFTILGSGFCIDRRGLIVTCRHVQEATVHPSSLARLRAAMQGNQVQVFNDLEAALPHAIFHHPDVSGGQVMMFPVPIMTAQVRTDFDLALMRLQPHKAFERGFPHLEILEYSKVRETMPVGICGFPLGNYLHNTFGAVGSTLTSGSLASIAPMRGVPEQHVRGFLLNAAATHGNSGGPVYSPQDGKVFGVLQGGPGEIKKDLAPYQGLTFAEPVWQVFRNNAVKAIMTMKATGPASAEPRPAPAAKARPTSVKARPKRTGKKLVTRR